jgi:Putative Actinobacterial Holin-X, holin superfamily III
MQDAPVSEIEENSDKGIGALIGQLRADASVFARAEVSYYKAQAGERATHARPGLALLVIGLAVACGALIALPVGLVLVLAPVIGAGLALFAVVSVSLLLAALMLWAGGRRLRSALKKPEDR